MQIVLGLGNPGARYRLTRHNVGFWVVDLLSKKWKISQRGAPGSGGVVRLAEGEVAGKQVVLAKPSTFMNRSGIALRKLAELYGLVPADVLAVHDDADLDLGRVRIRPGGSAGGHLGVLSLIDALGTQSFPRVKIGVRGECREGQDLADYVLSEFDPEEMPVARVAAEVAADAVEAVLENGVLHAMNAFNGRAPRG